MTNLVFDTSPTNTNWSMIDGYVRYERDDSGALAVALEPLANATSTLHVSACTHTAEDGVPSAGAISSAWMMRSTPPE